MATSTTELILKFTGDPRSLKATMAQVRAEMSQTAKSTEAVNKSELSTRQQLAAAASLQRQRSAALIAQWKQQERAAQQAATGTKPFGEVLQGLTQSIVTLQGPLGGLASRINSAGGQFSVLSTEAASAGTALSGMAGPIGIAVVGIAATAVAVGGLAKGLFSLAESTAQFQGKFQDLSQQVGVSAETLSALSAVAQTTGGSIESVTASLGIFQKNLEESLDSQSKSAQAFARLGVEVTDTEQTLRGTIAALAKMPEGFRQTALALELFGRGGKQVLAIVKESNGDLDGMIERMRGLGLVTTAQAQKADEFNDRLVLLSLAFKDIGSEAIPLIIDVLKDLQKTVNENKDAVDFLKLVVQGVTALFVGPFKGAIVAGDSVLKTHRTEIGLLTEAYQILAGAVRDTVAEIPKVNIPVPGQGSGLDLLREISRFGVPLKEKQDFSKIKGLFKPTEGEIARARAEAQSRANRSLQLQQQALEESTRRHREALERERDLDLKSIDEWEEESVKIATDHWRKQQDLFDQEEADIKRFVKNSQDQFLALSELLLKRDKEATSTLAAIQKAEDEAQKKRDHRNLKAEQELLQIRESQRQRQLAIIKRGLDDQSLTEAGAITKQLEILKEAHEERMGLIQAEIDLKSTSTDRERELNNERIKSEQDYTNEFEELTARRNAAREAEIRKSAPGAGGIPEPGGRVLSNQQTDALGALPLGPLGTFADELERVTGLSQNTAGIIANELGGAFSDLSNAVGQAVQSFVLFGKVEGGFKKFVANLIASIAASAAVQAVYQLAQGLAWLALNAFFPDPRYAAAASLAFASAAVFGSIAGVAAIAGRAVAGNSFNQQGAGGGALGGGASRSPAQPGLPNPVDINRNNNQPVIVQPVIVMRGEATEGFRYVVEKVLTESYRGGGKMNDIVQHGLGKPGFAV